MTVIKMNNRLLIKINLTTKMTGTKPTKTRTTKKVNAIVKKVLWATGVINLVEI